MNQSGSRLRNSHTSLYILILLMCIMSEHAGRRVWLLWTLNWNTVINCTIMAWNTIRHFPFLLYVHKYINRLEYLYVHTLSLFSCIPILVRATSFLFLPSDGTDQQTRNISIHCDCVPPFGSNEMPANDDSITLVNLLHSVVASRVLFRNNMPRSVPSLETKDCHMQ